MTQIKLHLFSAAADIEALGFIVRVLTGTPEELGETSLAWGYDGFEYLPDPEAVPDADDFATALSRTGASVPVINSGRIGAQGLSILHEDERVRARSIEGFERMLELAGAIGARTGLGMARGGAPIEGKEALVEEVFGRLAERAERAGTQVMLEPADPGAAGSIHTVAEAVSWVYRIDSPAFTVMLDTYQLSESERSLDEGVRDSEGRASHIHLYDPSRWPPGVRSDTERLDWAAIASGLREQRFSGTGSVVLAPSGDAETAARTSCAYLRELFSASATTG